MLAENEFRAEMARRRLTYKEIAEILGIHPSSMGRKMSAKAFNIADIDALAKGLNFSASDIIRIFFSQLDPYRKQK